MGNRCQGHAEWDAELAAIKRIARFAHLRDAVVEAAVAWAIARDSKIPVDIINDPFFDASNRLGAAVDAYQAAKEIP